MSLVAAIAGGRYSTRMEHVIAGRFEVMRELGRGAFAVTYAARDRRTDSTVAVKVLSLHTVDHWRAVELFEREARVLANLSYSSIPRYVDFIAPQDGDPTFVLAQELAPGRSLAARVKAGWRASEAELRHIADQLLDVLAYLHGLNPPVLHRDIKPDNVILSDDGRISLVDFGSVRDRLARESQLGSIVGTFGYMAPEQLQGRAGPATDLYGLGATLLHIVTGFAPAELPHRGLAIDLPQVGLMRHALYAWLERALAPDPEPRFTSAAEARRALPTETRVAPPPPLSAPSRSGTAMPTSVPGAFPEAPLFVEALAVAEPWPNVPVIAFSVLAASCTYLGTSDQDFGRYGKAGPPIMLFAALVFVICAFAATVPATQALLSRRSARAALAERIGGRSMRALCRRARARRRGDDAAATRHRETALREDRSSDLVARWLTLA